MLIDRYLFNVVGENPERVSSLHASTLRRLKAYAIAVHIPVMLWCVAGYVLASRVFGFPPAGAAAVAAFCSLLIYLVERLVLATPKAWYVNFGRFMIGVVMAVLGASMVDLVIFEREVSQQLVQVGEARIEAEYTILITRQAHTVAQSKGDWLAAQAAANCEANGTCGSRVRNVGPVYHELAQQADRLRADYSHAQVQLERLTSERSRALVDWKSSPAALHQAGLLARVEALHRYTRSNRAAFVAWLLLFTLVLFFELMVVLVKLVFKETVDDRIEVIREQISQHKATAYMQAITSPVAEARRLIEGTYG